jgi:saccharopine dehydrogenase (NADP+, L-glutamate forming)/spermidine synthase
MKRILVLGAGMVAGAHVRYLLAQPDFQVTVASRTLDKARQLVGSHPRGRAIQLDTADAGRMEEQIAEADLAVSLLPYVYHPVVARACVAHRVHLVTTSYVKEPMQALDEPARAAGVILLNEIGVDPGIDHMSAMRVIHRVQRSGGEITSFMSYTGGLPAPEANTNPFGYKFSWSPRGVLLAGKNPAHYLLDGKEVVIPPGQLFRHSWTVPITVDGSSIAFEGYPNRDSLSYQKLYGIQPAEDMFRGTLRYQGWCEILQGLAAVGYLDETARTDLAGQTFAGLTASLIGSRGDLRHDLARFLNVPSDSLPIRAYDWLGLLGADPLLVSQGAPIDVLTERMLSRMRYDPGERDMIVMQHRFGACFPDRRERIVSTLIDYGVPGGESSMARTVGLPAAIAVRLILQGVIRSVGVQTPVTPEIYDPVLDELANLGIRMSETTEVVAC